MRRRTRYWKEVFKSAIRMAGWAAGIATVVFGGSIVTAGGFLLGYHQRTLAVIVFAGGLLIATMEGSYRVWDASDKQLQLTEARPLKLDTPDAKRAYIDEMLAESEAMQEAIASVPDEDWPMRMRTANMDTIHWENQVRATLRKWFGPGTDVLFDSDEGLITPEDSQHSMRSKGAESSYLARRSKRLIEIRESL